MVDDRLDNTEAPLPLLNGHLYVGEVLLLGVEVGRELIEESLLLLAVELAVLESFLHLLELGDCLVNVLVQEVLLRLHDLDPRLTRLLLLLDELLDGLLIVFALGKGRLHLRERCLSLSKLLVKTVSLTLALALKGLDGL